MRRRILRRTGSLLLSLCLLIGLLPVSAWAKYPGYDEGDSNLGADYMEEIEDTGLVRMGFSELNYDPDTEEYYSTIELVIRPDPKISDLTGYSLTLPDYSEDNPAPWWSTGSGRNEYKKVYIEEGVRGIGDNAFQNMTTLEYVQLPTTLETIGDNAFYGVSGAKFDNGDGGTTLDLSSVVSIGDSAFRNCTAMGGTAQTPVTVRFGAALTTIGTSAFQNAGLSRVDFSKAGSAVIGDSAFAGNRLTALDLSGSGITEIGASAFEDNPLTSLALPNSLSSIGRRAFYRSTPTQSGIASLVIPANVNSIGESAFENNMQLSQVEILSKSLTLGDKAFGNTAENAYHDQGTLTQVEYVDGDLATATSGDIETARNVAYSYGAEFRIPAELADYFTERAGEAYYAGNRSPLVYNEAWSYPATCLAEGLDAYFYTLGDYTNVLHREPLDRIDHVYYADEGYNEGYYDPSCTVGGYTQLFCDENMRAANSHWPEVPAPSTRHAGEREYDGTNGIPGHHNYQVTDIENPAIAAGNTTTITYICQNNNHDDNMEAPPYTKERTVSFAGVSLTATTTQTAVGTSNQNKLTLPTVEGGTLAWNTALLTSSNSTYGQYAGENLPAGTYRLPVVFTPSGSSSEGLPPASGDGQMDLTITVTVSKVELDFTNTRFENNNRYIGLGNEDFNILDLPGDVVWDWDKATYSPGGSRPDENETAQPGNYQITVPFTYSDEIYAFPTSAQNNYGLTIVQTGAGQGTITGPYNVLQATMDNIQADAQNRTYTLRAGAGGTPEAVEQSIVQLTGVLTGSTVTVQWKKAGAADWEKTETYSGTTASTLNVAFVTQAGDYDVLILVENGTYQDREISLSSVTVNRRSVALPQAVEGLTYNGSSQTGTTDGSTNNALYYTVVGGSNSAINAGTHTARFQLDTNNCFWADGTGSAENTVAFTIAKRAIRKISITDDSHSYDGGRKSAVTYDGSGNSYTYEDSAALEDTSVTRTYSFARKPAFEITAVSAVDAGTYMPEATILDTTNFYWEGEDPDTGATSYVLSENGWTIAPMPLTQQAPVVTQDVDYTGKPFDESNIQFTLNSEVATYFRQEGYHYFQGSNASSASSIPHPINAGSNYYVAANLVPLDGVNPENFLITYTYSSGTGSNRHGRASFTIEKVPLRLLPPEEENLKVSYTGQPQTAPVPSWQESDLVGQDADKGPEDGVFTFQYSITDPDGTSSGPFSEPPTRTAVGEYRVTVSIQSTNYYGVGNDVGGTTNTLDYTWTIQAAENTIALTDESITEGDKTVAPDGIVEKPLTHAPFTILGTPFCDSEVKGDETVEATVTYALDDDPSNPQDVIRVDKTTGQITPLRVGEAKVNVTVSALINYGETTVSFSVEVTPGTPEVGVEDQTFPYGTDISNPGNDLKPYNDLSNVTITSSAHTDAVKPTGPSADNLTFTLYDTEEQANAGGDAGKITDVSGLGAGTYHLRVDYAGDANYASAFDVGTLTVRSISMDAAPVSDMEFNYDGSDHYNEMVQKVKEAVTVPADDAALTVTIIKANSDESTAPGPDSDRWNSAAPSVVNVGTDGGLYFYRIQAENYAMVTGSFRVTINPITVTVSDATLTNTGKIYNGNTNLPEGNTLTSDATATGSPVAITVDVNGQYASANASENAEIQLTYTVTFGGDVPLSNFVLANSEAYTTDPDGRTWTIVRTAKGSIDRAKLTVTGGIDAVPRPYNGDTRVSLKVAENGITFEGKAGQDDVTLSLRAGATGTLQPSAPGADDAADAGIGKAVTVQKGDIEITGEDAGNYDIETAYTETAHTTQVDIAKAQRTLTFNQDEEPKDHSFSVSYDGNPLDNTDLAITVTGYADGDPQATVEYKFYSDESYSTEIDQSATSAAGTYYVTAILPEKPNYAPVEVRAVITVDRSELTITPDNPTYTGTYTGASHKGAILDVITVAGIGGELTLGEDYTLFFQAKTEGEPAGDGWIPYDNPALTFTNAETTTYWVRVDAESYRSRVVEMEITISPAALTLGSQLTTQRDYDGTNSATVTNGSVSGAQNNKDIWVTDVTAAYDTKDVGTGKTITTTYTLAFGSGVMPGNYEIANAGAVVEGGDTSTWTVKTTVDNGEIRQAQVTVTIQNQEDTYDGAPAELKEDAWETTQGKFFQGDDVVITLSADGAQNAGPHSITGSAGGSDAGNYQISFVAGTLTILPRPVATQIGGAAGVYGNEHSLSAGTGAGQVILTDITAEGTGGIVDTENIYSVLTGLTLRTDAEAKSPVGNTYTISASGGKGEGQDVYGNYQVTFTEGKFTVTKRSVTVTIYDKDSLYGQNLVALDWAVTTGTMAEGEDLGITLATDATAGSGAGDYAIYEASRDEAVAANYEVTVVGETAFGGDTTRGTYTIGKAVLTVAPDRPVVYAQYNQSIANPLTFTNASITDGEITAGSADYNALSAVVSYAFQPADGLTLTSTGDRAAGEFTVNVSNQTVTVTVTVPETDNFEGATASYAVQASSSGDLNVRLPFAERTYNGTAQQLLREGPALPEGIAIRYKVGESGTWTAYSSEDSENWKQVTGTDAVPYTVYWETTAGGGYSASSGSAVTSIAQAEIVGTFTDLPDGSISFLLAEIPDKYVIPLDLSQNPNYTHIDGSGVSYFSNNLDVASALNGTATLELRGGTGTAEITITCLGDTNYKATTLKFTVTVSETMQEIKVDTSTTGDQSVPYNGEAQTIQPVKAQNLAEGDYAVHYWNEQTQQYDLTEPPAYVDVKRPAGDATGTPEAYVIGYQITATGYTPATGTVNLTITPKEITAGMFEKSIGFYTYTGMPITPEPVVVDGNALLAEVTDYTVDWGTNTAPGEDAGSVTVTGRGNYTSSATVTFNINPVGSGLTALLSPGYGVYDPAAPATATVTVTHHTASDHEVLLTADNTVYDITARDLTTGTEIADHGAIGSGDTLTFTQPGVYDITLKLTGDHEGTFHFTYTLLPMSGGDGGLTLTVGDDPQKVYTYGDTDIDGVIQVKAGDTDVTALCDLTYVYTPFDGTGTTEPKDYTPDVLKAAGVYTVTATPNNASVTGTGTFVFLIQQRNLSEADLAVAGGLIYDGAAQEPAVTVTLTGNPEEGRDYTVSYHDNVSASVNGAQAVITAAGNNFTGSAGAAFSIAPKPITDSSVVIGAIDDQPYTGGPIYPALTITDTDIDIGTDTGEKEKYPLVLGHDYLVGYANGANSTAPGTATLTITGTGNYDGSTEVSFTITSEPAPEPEEEFILSVTPDSTWVYGRAPADLDLSVTFGEDNELILGTDYTLTVSGVIYDDTDGRTLADAIAAIKALEPGDYTVTAQGTGIYEASSDTASLTVRKIPTTVDAAVSPSSLSGGGTVTLTLQGTDLPAGTDLSALLTVSTANGTDLALEDLEWTQAGGVWTASFNAANANETYTFTLRFAGDAYYEGDSDTALLVTARRTSGGGGGGGTVDPEPEEPTVADPDDTGVSGWLNTDDHMAYLSGYPDGTFGPNQNMTRAEAAQMFYNLLLDKDVAITTSFSDVDGGTWYADAVNTLASLGIINGVGGDRFEPERSITRAEFTAIAMRFAHLETGGENRFSDVREEDWFYDIVVGSIQYGWINGYPDGTFRPDSSITRSEVTTITNRMLGRSADEDYADRHAEDLRSFSDLRDTHWAYYDICEAANAHDYRKSGGEENWTGLN